MKATSIMENLLFTTVRIEAINGSECSIGTGFIFGYRINEKVYPFLVTNKHVVKGYSQAFIHFTREENDEAKLGSVQKVRIDNFNVIWLYPDDDALDVAVTPIGDMINELQSDGNNLFFRMIEQSIIPTTTQVNELDAIEDIIFIGYPSGLWDSKNNLPIIRKGITASPIYHNFEEKPVFLIDASVFPGSSGSPVFVFNKGTIADKQGNVTIGNRIMFLGIVAAVMESQNPEILKLINTSLMPSFLHKEKLNIGIVFKFPAIISLIENYLRKRSLL